MFKIKLMLPFEKLTNIQEKFITTATISAQEIQFCFNQLQSNDDECIILAADLLTDLDKPIITNLLELFHNLPQNNQKFLIPFLCGTEVTKVYTFLLDYIQSSPYQEIVDLITLCLSKTQFPITPLLLIRIQTPYYNTKPLFEVIKHLPFSQVKPYLQALPSIPNEQKFRNIFGDEEINQIKSHYKPS